MALKIGTTVWIKGDATSPTMSVHQELTGDIISCTWFINGKREEGDFHKDQLTETSPDAPYAAKSH